MDNQNNNIYSNDNVNSDDFNAGDNINVINNVNADSDNNAGNRINNSASDNRVNIGDLYGMNDLRRNAQPPRKKKSQGFASGMIIGAVSAFMAVILLILSVAAVCIAKGYIHIGVNGDVYIQSDAVTDSDGIGSEVEGKLNAIDSVLESFYFGDVDDETAKDNIYKAYLSSYGDKYTMYYTADEYKALKESTNGKFYGIGAVCQLSGEGGVLLVDVYDNGAGYQAGLRSGDRVVNVDGRDITDMELSSAVALIKGDKGTSVTLEVIRGTERLTFSAVRDAVEAKTVSYTLLDNNIGYLSISQFEEVTTKQFKAAVEDLQSQGMKGLVIDIRNNPGGLLDTVVGMLKYMLPDGLIVYTEDKQGNRKEYKGQDNDEFNLPLAVIVNGNSASASEIFAGAIQDYGKGTIIGTQTYGKGIVQTVKPLTDGSAIKFTIAKYFTPKGQDIHGKGVTPDMVVEYDTDADVDTQLDAAIKNVEAQIN
ncbi:S41 family peptidase [Lachnospira rogosae (ex Hitch et al. 2025)]|uniref:S41 family peptidase n=1 Tax=[Lactobacillus] rogosae TaxID=706562 RepID=UPI0032BF7923